MAGHVVLSASTSMKCNLNTQHHFPHERSFPPETIRRELKKNSQSYLGCATHNIHTILENLLLMALTLDTMSSENVLFMFLPFSAIWSIACYNTQT